ncbi:hypothetical protein ACTHQ4_13410 [Alkalicoccobacillus gibsonii]|uniref:hypothetical protein n=1 Tax=Alkalicoccobacillus gibsonii TaxID=79881 RepID=UPI003F7B8C17
MDITTNLAIFVMILFILVSIFQVLLAFGFPFGEYAMGGYHRILPNKLRIMSVLNGIILLLMGMVFLMKAEILDAPSFLPTKVLVWVFTGFLALNTVGNLASQSKKERIVMTPLSGLMFVMCLIIALS